MHRAIEALWAAAESIKSVAGISNVTVDNDHRSGEILFTVGTEQFRLKLEQVEGEE